MAAVASQTPTGFLSGVSMDNNFQPLDQCGTPNPFFYHILEDDFSPYRATDYTVTASGTGAAVAAADGDGGVVLLTGGTTAGAAGIQGPNTSFSINSQPKKVFFECRAQLAVVNDANVTFIAGLLQKNAAGVPTDGVYFSYTNGVWTINSAKTSVVTSVTIPSAAITTTAATNFDIGFFINRLGDVLAYIDTQLIGYVPQSNLGTSGNPQNAGAVARITAPALTTAVLAPGVWVVQAGTNAGRTATVDLLGAFKER